MKIKHCIRVFTLLTFLLSSGHAYTSTVLQVDMDDLIAQAKLIFEGEVISQQSRWNDNHSGIYTLITFRVDEVVKGEYNETTLSLQFSGGIVGNEGMNVSSMVYPALNEQGVYFVEDPDRDLVNPLVGWSQGHFLIEQDADGEQRILSASHRPVLAMPDTSDKSLLNKTAADHRPSPFSECIVKGIDTADKNSDKKQAMSKNAFKAAIKQRLNPK